MFYAFKTITFLFLTSIAFQPNWVAAQAQDCTTLEKRIQNQFSLYKSAREFLIENAIAKTGFPRDIWEAKLTPSATCALTSADLTQIKLLQSKKIAQAKATAITNSKFNFSNFRDNASKVKQFCASFPKGGMLHVHPKGTLDGRTIQFLLDDVNPTIDPEIIKMLTTLPAGNLSQLNHFSKAPFREMNSTEQQSVISLFFLNESGPYTFANFGAIFNLMDYVLPVSANSNRYLDRMVMDFAARAKKMGVRYAELTNWIKLSDESFTAIQDLSKAAFDQSGVVIKWNFAFNRQRSWKSNSEVMDAFLTLMDSKDYSDTIVGIDLLADETDAPALDASQRMYGKALAASLGRLPGVHTKIHRTIHAGELGDVRNPRDALIMGAERIGHGILLKQDPIALEWAARNHIAVETNLTSNLLLGSVNSIKTHPFLDYLRLGLPVSLSTDDEGMMKTNMNKECEVAVSKTDISYSELKAMSLNSIKTSFASDQIKASLLLELQNEFTRFETQQNF